jgi:AAHS family 4-hydroxybenzoate transporter-like MFS transporter
MSGQTIDVSQVIEGRKLNAFNYHLIIGSWLIAMFDGFDLSIAAFASTYMRDELGMSPGQLANVLSAGLLGTALGALIFSWLSDKIGRRPVLIGCSFAFGLLTAATGLAPTYEWLLAIRFLDGVALGANVPIIWALNSEYVPKRFRATVITVIMVGFSVGTSGAGPIVVALEPLIGWRGIMFMGGAGSVLVALYLIYAMPESIRWLVARKDRPGRVAAILHRMTGRGGDSYPADGHYVLGDEAEAKPQDARLSDLFAGWLAWATPLVWIAYIAASFAIYYVNGWGPIIFEGMGFDRETGALATAFGGVMGSVAGLVMMRTTDRRGLVTVLFYPVLLLPVLLVLGLMPLSQDVILILAMVVLALIGGMTFVLLSIIAPLYPTAIRGNGSGWAQSVAKLGAVLGPLFGGFMSESGMPIVRGYAILAVVPAIVVLSTIGILMAQKRAGIRNAENATTETSPT